MATRVFPVCLIAGLAAVTLINAQQASLPCTSSSSCPGGHYPSNYTSCCGSFGCCTPKAYTTWSNLLAGLTGQCAKDFSALNANCLHGLVQCLNTGQAASKCSTIIQSCGLGQVCTSGYLTCNMTMSFGVYSGQVVNKSAVSCVPRSCAQSSQINMLTNDMLSTICSVVSSSFCAMRSLRMQCPGVKTVTCNKNTFGKIRCAQLSTPTGGHGSHQSSGSQSGSHVCMVAGKRHQCPGPGNDPRDNQCCMAGGQFLGCCTSGVQSFVGDMFGQFNQSCTKSLVSSPQGDCYKKFVACQDNLQTSLQGKTGLDAVSTLAALRKDNLNDCLLFSGCVNSSTTAYSNCSANQRLCHIEVHALSSFAGTSIPIPQLSQFNFPKLSSSNYLCLPDTCSSAQEQVVALSRMIYTSVCYPICSMTGSFKSILNAYESILSSLPYIPPGSSAAIALLQNTGCFVEKVVVSCSGGLSHTSTYTPVGEECQYQNITLPFLRTPTNSGTSPKPGNKPSDPGSPSSGKKSSSHSKTFIFASVGGILVIVAVVLGVVLYRRRRRARSDEPQAYSVLQEDLD